jgi:molybdopterin-guanine dinucleotide biosynthesis protein A
VVPVSEGSMEPLVAVYPKAAHALVIQRLQGKQHTVRAFAEACQQRSLVSILRFDPAPRDFTNWNSPDDVARGCPAPRGAVETSGNTQRRVAPLSASG